MNALANTELEVRKRVRSRCTSKEKDDSTGLYYHGARYYAAWLGRWTATDPAGMVDGLNLYTYVSNNPIRLRDLEGMAEDEPNFGIGLGEKWGQDLAINTFFDFIKDLCSGPVSIM